MSGAAARRAFDVVFFDLYGTLVDIRTDEESDAAWMGLGRFVRDHGGVAHEAQEFRRWFVRLRDERIAALGGDDPAADRYVEPDVLGVYREILSSCGAVGDPDELARGAAWSVRRASTSLLRLYPGALDMLARIRGSGRRAVLVSNAQSGYTRPEVAELGLTSRLDRILISSEEGVRKPDPRFFGRALELESVAPERVVMVGNDQTSDILGAARCGIEGVYMHTEISPGSDDVVCSAAALSVSGADYRAVERFVLG